jgi:hypothetical protein
VPGIRLRPVSSSSTKQREAPEAKRPLFDPDLADEIPF